MAERLLAHFIAGYPDMAGSLAVAQALVRGGAAALEMQFPYSDPVADGPVIQAACQRSLEAGFKVARGFALARTITDTSPNIPLYIMSYAGLVVARGIDAFCADAKESGVSGLIVPDLSPGSDEGLYEAGMRFKIDIVPVLVPSVQEERLDAILALRPSWVYAALRAGITGEETGIEPDTLAFLGRIRARGVKIMAGFGIRTADQVRAIGAYCDLVIAGSALVRTIEAALAEGSNPGTRVAMAVQSLIS